MKNIDIKNFNYRKSIGVIGVFLVYCVVFLFLLHNTDRLIDSLIPLRVGDLVNNEVSAKKNIKFIDEKATEEKRREAVENTYSVYARDDSKFRPYINYLRQDAQYKESERGDYMRLELVLNDIYKSGFFDVNELKNDRKEKIEFEGSIYEKSDLLSSSNIRNYILTNLKNREDLQLTAKEQNFILTNIQRYLTPNATFSLIRTTERENEAREKIEPVIVDIEPGDLILVKDEIITQQKYENLIKIRSLESKYSITVTILCLFFAFFYIFFIFFALDNYVFSSNKLRGGQYFRIAIVIQLLFLLASLLEFWIFVQTDKKYLNALFLIPLPSIIISALSSDKKSGYVILYLNVLLFIIIPFIDLTFLLRCVISTIVMIEFLNPNKQRIESFLMRWIVVFFFAIVSVFLVDMSISGNFTYILTDCILEIVKYIFCAMVMSAVVAIVQKAINLPSVSQLEKLANQSSALLDKFKSVCTGSFEHSEIVADIAESAASAINANALLVKAAARYHDVGKMEHPEYFIENQKAVVSKHQVIKNKLSAAIIKSHVPLGVKLLKEHKFPLEVIEIVSQHHGNDLIAYFYFEAKKEAESAGVEVEKSDYSYQSDIPTTKESAILMLSDISEAATRSQTNPMTLQELRNFIHMLIQNKIQNGQLDNSTLTIGELRIIEESIFNTIKGKLHKRIAYPKGDENKG